MRQFTIAIGVVLLVVGCGIVEAAESWQVAADKRIEKHRKAPLTVRVVDSAGNPVAGAKVHVAMRRHAFGWGTAVNAKMLATLDENDPYKRWIPKLFNQATLNNAHKWKFQEKDDYRQWAAEAVTWLGEHRLKVHGHTMIWATLKYGAMPADVVQTVKADSPDLDFLRRRSMEHIATVGKRLDGKVISWDVVNEPFSERAMQKILTPDAKRGCEPILVDWYKAARLAAPDVPLYINDFHILVGDKVMQKDYYERTIKYLLEKGAPLGGIGMQCHYYHAKLRRTPEQMLATLDRFGKFGLPIHLSEFDMFGGGWPSGAEREKVHAEFMREIMTVAFSHPKVVAFTIWNFWDGRHWKNEAPLFRKDWTPKPALAVYRDLVFNKWWTDKTLRTGAQGRAALRGFLGEYEVTVAKAGHAEKKQRVAIGAKGASLNVSLE